MFGEFLHNRHQWSCKDGNEGHREVFASLNDRKVQGKMNICAQNVVGIARLKLWLPQCSQMIWWTEVLQLFVVLYSRHIFIVEGRLFLIKKYSTSSLRIVLFYNLIEDKIINIKKMSWCLFLINEMKLILQYQYPISSSNTRDANPINLNKWVYAQTFVNVMLPYLPVPL